MANEAALAKGVSPEIRKNRRPTCPGNEGGGGIDLNRNFGFHWEAKFDPCGEEYQGSKPFSEPETQAIKGLCEQNGFSMAVNFHAFGAMLTHPFNWARKPDLPTDDERVYDEVNHFFNYSLFGPAIDTVGYTTPGESDDWMYGAMHIISMSPEVGPESGGFWPSHYDIEGIDRRNFDRIQYVAQKSGLEFAASWAYKPAASSARWPSIARSLRAGSPASVLELQLANRGLRDSIGWTLAVAVSGMIQQRPPTAVNLTNVGNDSNAAADGVAVTNEDGELMPTWISRGTTAQLDLGSPLLFQLPPLGLRHQRRLHIFVDRAVELHSDLATRELGICALEVARNMSVFEAVLDGNVRRICHCVDASGAQSKLVSSFGASVAGVAAEDGTVHPGAIGTRLERLCEALAVAERANRFRKLSVESVGLKSSGSFVFTSVDTVQALAAVFVLLCCTVVALMAWLAKRRAASVGAPYQAVAD